MKKPHIQKRVVLDSSKKPRVGFFVDPLPVTGIGGKNTPRIQISLYGLFGIYDGFFDEIETSIWGESYNETNSCLLVESQQLLVR